MAHDVVAEEQILRSSPLLAAMDPATAHSLMELMGRRELPRGEVLFFEGSPGDAVYMIVRGKVKMGRTARDGRENLLSIHGVGDMVGELSLFDPANRIARAYVPEDSIVYELSRASFEQWIAEHGDQGVFLLQALAKRMRRNQITMADLVFTDVPGRVAKAILDLGRRFGHMDRGQIIVRHGLTQEELAQLVGASRETVNKALADFAGRGWIDVNMGAVVVYEPDRLRARSR